MTKRKSTVIKHIHQELSSVARKLEYDSPVIHDHIIMWDGPFEWAILMMGGYSVIAMELCHDSLTSPLACEKPLQAVINKAVEDGYTIECETAHSLGVYF